MIPGRARCPTPWQYSRMADGRHVADLGERTSVDIADDPRPRCRGCGEVLMDDPRFPEYWVSVRFLIVEEPW